VTYAYDANGSRTSKIAGATTTYGWNSDNLLTGTSSPSLSTSYVYDGENQRVAATENGVATAFVLDPAASDELVLQEITGEDATTYTYGAGLVSRETASGIRYLLSDALGSVRLETDEAGQIVREHSYEAFGAELGTGNRFRFTGQWSDASGLTFLRARCYDSETGTFLSVDPVPSAASRYMYCGNNPLLRVDPSGMSSVNSALAGLAGAANFVLGYANVLLPGTPIGMLAEQLQLHGPYLNWSYRIGQADAMAVSFVAGVAQMYNSIKGAHAAGAAAKGSLSGSALAQSGLPAEEKVSTAIGIARNVGTGRVTVSGSGPGGFRVPDFDPSLTIPSRGTMVEVKDTARLSATSQLRDLVANALGRGVPLEVFTNASLPRSGELFDWIAAGDVIITPLP